MTSEPLKMNDLSTNSTSTNCSSDSSAEGGKHKQETIHTADDKPICAECKLQIEGRMVNAMNKTWHPQHFKCEYCKKQIKGNFNVNCEKAYCEEDYAFLFLHRCRACNLPIRDVVIVALNTHWHRDHFVCASCGVILSEEGYFEKDDEPFCGDCFQAKFAPKCTQCHDPIQETAVVAMNQKYHQMCFKCHVCQMPLIGPTFEVINEKIVCTECGKKLKASA